MYLLDKGSVETAIVTSVYVEKKYLGKCKCEFCGTLINTGEVDQEEQQRLTHCESRSRAILDFFLSSDASIGSAMAFPPLGNSDHVVVTVSNDFPSN